MKAIWVLVDTVRHYDLRAHVIRIGMLSAPVHSLFIRSNLQKNVLFLAKTNEWNSLIKRLKIQSVDIAKMPLHYWKM